MSDKKKFLLNCEVCDARKIKEEDYKDYEQIKINTELVIVDEESKSILNRLPVTMNQESMIELPEGMQAEIRTINGKYEITGNTDVKDYTLLIVNGPLLIHPNAQETLGKYYKIVVNGPLRCPKSIEENLGKISINGPVKIYPDDCIILDKEFHMDKYFPLRAKEGKRYYAENMVIIGDTTVDMEKLVAKNVEFVTNRLLVHESKVEECIPMFDENVEFVVVPDGMKIIYGKIVLDEKFVKKEGNKLFVYGSVEVSPECDMKVLGEILEKLIVKGDITLSREQEESFQRMDAEYDSIIYRFEGRVIVNKVNVSIDEKLLENSVNGIRIQNVAMVNIAEEVSQQLILEKLEIMNCAKVICSKEQKSAVAVISQNVAMIGEEEKESSLKDLFTTKVINAESYIM